LVGPYAEADALLPLRVLREQRKALVAEELTDLFRMECALIPLLLDMRFRGVRVNLAHAQTVASRLREQARVWQQQIPGVDVWSADTIARAFDAAGLEYGRTDAGAPSFTRPFLEGVHHPLAEAVLGVRLAEKAANPFVESYILGGHHSGRIHCQFHPLRSDTYGTVSGRFSSSNPNLQNIPSRDPVIGPLLRSLFIPEEGGRWKRADYSQIEYRLLAHDAVGPGAEAIRERYRNDPTTDFHEMTMHMVKEQTGVEMGRKPSKNLNFGLVYGMGREKTTRSLGVSQDLGERLYDAYFEALPSVKRTYKSAERLARRRGYIKTVLKRRRRFPDGDGTHKALNARLQGGAADVMKKAMVDCYRAGVFDATGIPHLTVHDELDWTDDGTSRAAEGFAEAERIMCACIPLRVPLMVDMSSGAHWGECL
jgi:DNA polymerase I-like protein with 3'-5' exonuclease and polymerase domains